MAIFHVIDSQQEGSRYQHEPRQCSPGEYPTATEVKYDNPGIGQDPDGGTVYYAEDADGDGITETFTVESRDGFQWGFKSGPNVVCIDQQHPERH